MTRVLAPLAAAVCVATLGLQAQQSAPRVTRMGGARQFGPGIVQATAAHVGFELSREAHVIVLQVDPSGGITPMFPADTASGVRTAGILHVVAAPAPTRLAEDEARINDPVLQNSREVARAGTAVWKPAVPEADEGPVVGYWLVIVSDVPTSGVQARAQLETMDLAFSTVEAELRALPRALVGSRTKTWGAWYTAVR